MRRLICMILMTTLLALPALAEDVCVVDAASASHVTTGCPYLMVECALEGETNVLLTLRDEWGSLIYQRDYGRRSGQFRSRDIHLPVENGECDYTVTLTLEGGEYRFIVTREQPMLTDSAVYAGGVPLLEINGGSAGKYAAVLDLYEMNGQTLLLPMLAGESLIGEVSIWVQNGEMIVNAELFCEGRIDKAKVFVATDAITASTLGTKRFTGVKEGLDRAVFLGDSPYAAVMVQLTVTYDPEFAQPFTLDQSAEESYQQMLYNWQLMQMTTANEAVG